MIKLNKTVLISLQNLNIYVKYFLFFYFSVAAFSQNNTTGFYIAPETIVVGLDQINVKQTTESKLVLFLKDSNDIVGLQNLHNVTVLFENKKKTKFSNSVKQSGLINKNNSKKYFYTIAQKSKKAKKSIKKKYVTKVNVTQIPFDNIPFGHNYQFFAQYKITVQSSKKIELKKNHKANFNLFISKSFLSLSLDYRLKFENYSLQSVAHCQQFIIYKLNSRPPPFC